MPNVSRDLTPLYDNEIDAEPVHVCTDVVSSSGYVGPDSLKEYEFHTFVWAPMENKGQLRTTKFNETKEKHEQTFIQDGGDAKIGSAEWKDKRVVIIVLNDTVEH